MNHLLKSIGIVTLALLCSCATSTPDNTLAVAPSVDEPAQTGDAKCRHAVAITANRPIDDTSVLTMETSRAGEAYKIALKGANRPWSCIIDASGMVSNVMYMGEG